MFFDLQFSQAKFLEMLRDQVQRAVPLVTDTFDSPFGGDPLVIDHLDVNGVVSEGLKPATIVVAAPGGGANVNGNNIKIKINLTAKVTTRAQVISAGHLTPVGFLLPFALWVRAEISAKADQGAMVLVITPVQVGDDGGQLTAANAQALLAKIPVLTRAIPLPDVAGQSMTVSNAGITLANGVVAILAEISAPTASTVSSWNSFYAGGFLPRGGDWSILLPADLIVNLVDKAITDAVDSFPDKDPSIEIVSEPDTSWLGAGVFSTATINAVDACPVLASDIEADLNFMVSFSLDGDKIKVSIDVSWDLSDWDVFRCGLATVVLPGAIITVVAGAIFGPIGAIVAAVLTIIAFIVALVKISDVAHGKLSDGVGDLDPGSFNLHTVTQDDDHAVIEGSVAMGGLMSGMVATSVVGTPTGLQIGGTMTVPPHQERSLHIVGQNGFSWDAGYSCSSFSWQVDQIDASVGITEPANYPVQAKVEMLTVPASAYKATLTMYAPVTGFGVSVHSSLAANVGPDCEMLLWSNSGVRYAKFSHLPAEPEAPSAQQLIEAKIGCMKFAPQGPKKWLEAHWLVDPPPYDKVIEQIHMWDIVAGKLQAGTLVQVAIMGPRGDLREIAAMKAGSNGQAAFRFTTTRNQSVAVFAEHGMETMSLFRAGADLEVVAQLTPLSPALSATIFGTGANAQVHITTATETVKFGLDGRTLGAAAIKGLSPSLLGQLALEDLSLAALVETGADKLGGAIHALSLKRPVEGDVALKQRHVSSLPAAAHGDSAVTLRPSPVTGLRPDGGRTARWYAEPWMKSPIRVGNLAARLHKGTVTVYRYRKMRMF